MTENRKSISLREVFEKREMKKILGSCALFIFFIALFFSFGETAKAAFIKVGTEGGLLWQVLGEKDESEAQLKVGTTDKGQGVELRLKTKDGKTSLRIAGPSGETEMDVSEIEGDLLEIEERQEDSSIKVRLRGDKFEIRQKGVGALTNFPLGLNTDTNELTVATPSGTKVVSVLPAVALERILSLNIIDSLTSSSDSKEEKLIELEEENGKLLFKIKGTKDIKFLGLFPLTIPVEAKVSAETGEVVSAEEPAFVRFFGFLFQRS